MIARICGVLICLGAVLVLTFITVKAGVEQKRQFSDPAYQAELLINQSQQINGALIFLANDHPAEILGGAKDLSAPQDSVSAELAMLVSYGYLSSVPTPAAGNPYRISEIFSETLPEAIGIDSRVLYTNGISDDVCSAIEKKSRKNPSLFGCVAGTVAGSKHNTFWYRLR